MDTTLGVTETVAWAADAVVDLQDRSHHRRIMQFKDAAREVLKDANRALHYSEITNIALARRLLETSGKTPDAPMGALLYTDTLRPESPFRRGALPHASLKPTSPILGGTSRQGYCFLLNCKRREIPPFLGFSYFPPGCKRSRFATSISS